MLKKYIKLTLNKKNTFSFIKLNIIPFILELLLFFILPAFIKQHYIIGQYEAILLNATFLFLFEYSIVFISKHTLAIYIEEKKYNEGEIPSSKLILKALTFAFFKTIFFVLFSYLFKKTIKLSLYSAFIFSFFSTFFFLCAFWLPSILIKNSFFSSLKKSIRLYISHPFFTAFVFLHSLLLLFFSMFLLNVYPGLSIVTYNMHVAINLMGEADENCMRLI